MSSISENTVSYIISKGSDQPVLFATQSGTAAKPKLPFTFKHKLAQVKIILSAQEGLSLDDLSTVLFKGGVTDVKMNVLTGELTTGTTKGDITLTKEAEGTYSSYIVPQAVDNTFAFVMTLGGMSYTLSMDKVNAAPTNLDSGSSYTFKAKLTKDGKVVNPDGSTIGDINDGGTSDGGDVTPDDNPDTPGTEEPGTEEPGTEPEQPTSSNLLFPGADFEDFAAFTGKLNKFGLQNYATQADDPDQGKVLQIKGTPQKNDYVFTVENVEVKANNPLKITFKMKGECAGKSISINVYDKSGNYVKYNLGDITTDAKISVAESNQYNGSINTNGKWITITLDLTGVEVNTSGSGNLFALKVGKEAAWDVMLDDFEIE